MNYEWVLPLRTGGLLVSVVFTAYALVTQQPVYWVPGLLLSGGQVWALVRYLNRQNQELTHFLDGLRQGDFSDNLQVARAPASVRQARQLLGELNQTFARLTRQKQEDHLYLENILALIDTGILSFSETDGTVHRMNESLQRLLRVPYLKSIGGLARRDAILHETLRALRPGQQRVVKIGGQAVLLSMTGFVDEGGRQRLVAFQPVADVLDDTETQAYAKILRVLTHEIMNSVAPIASLAATLQARLTTAPAVPEEVKTGVGVIQKRSEGLLQFTRTYRQLSRLSATALDDVPLFPLVDDVLTLLEPMLAARQIEPEVIMPDPTVTIRADRSLIEQVLINLVTNAIDALGNVPQPQLTVLAHRISTRVEVALTDNGTGISADRIDDIFVPFFTTKEQGSGIGLSLSRQIMHLHGGSLRVESGEGRGSTFTLTFAESGSHTEK